MNKYFKKVTNIYLNMRIKNKILLFVYGIIVLISLIQGTYSYITTSQILKNQAVNTSINDTTRIINNLNFIIKDLEELSTSICVDENIQHFIRSTSSDKALENQRALLNLNNLLVTKSYISFIGIYTKSGDSYLTSEDGSNTLAAYDLLKEDSTYKIASFLKGTPIWFVLNKNNPIILDNKNQKLAMVRVLIDTNSYTESGFLTLCINTKALEDLVYPSLEENHQVIYIQDQANQTILSNNTSKNFTPPLINANSQEMVVKSNSQYITTSQQTTNGFKVTLVTDLNSILSTTKTILYNNLLVTLSLCILALICTHYIAGFLTSPINKLVRSINKVKEGNFKVKANLKYKDELGILGDTFDEMVDNINDLINRVYKLNLKEKEAELKALEAQINPHFLYNTLDTIYWKALKSQDVEISETVYALSRLFRLSLNKGHSFTHIKAEEEFISHYLLIQKKRFKEALSYTISIDPNMYTYSIPKLILQPFVENAIIHGLEPSQDHIHIHIIGNMIEDKLLFIIQDNGIGIDEKKLSILNSLSLQPAEKRESYGIYNIIERLKLNYDKAYSLTIRSSLTVGTTVEIMIPVIQEERLEVKDV